MNLQFPFQIKNLYEVSAQTKSRGHILFNLEQCGAFLCTQGVVEVRYEAQSYTITPGAIYIYMPSTLVRLGTMSDDAQGLIIAIDIDYIIPIIQRVMNVESMFFFRKYPCIGLTPEQYEFLHSQLINLKQRIEAEAHIVSTPQQKRLAFELIKSICQTVIFELLNIYFINQPIHPLLQDKKEMIFQNFIVLLFSHFHHERNVSFYAEKQGLTPRYFSSIIKEKSGMTPLQWIVRMVINESRQLLEASDMSIKEIAIKLNFPTQSFFGKYFKLYMGVSPKEYRNERK